MVSITQLEYLLSVEKHRHFAKAAKACNVSQPTLSIQIQKVENELNLIIFDRSMKPIMLTNRGQAIIEQAKKVLHEYSKLSTLADDQQLELQGDFRLAVIPTLAPYLIPLFVGKFSKRFPKINLIVNEYKTDQIITLLNEDKLDGGLLVTPLKNHHIIERVLFHEPFYGFVSKSHPLYKKKMISEKDLSRRDLWLLSEGHCFRNQMLNICSIDNGKAPLGNVLFESGNLDTLANLVRKNGGVTLLPQLATKSLSSNEKAKNLKSFSKPVPTREVSLVHSRSFIKEKILNELEKTIINNLPKDIYSYKKGKFEVIPI